ncbi:MAG TPA: succinylglutamate desuccinylase/aspartoacylase family protein [Candidatus Saccharimonadales bacterium]
MPSSDIIEINGKGPGPTLAIFAGVHGNELAGVYALQELIPGLKINIGKLYIVFANPETIEKKVRMINKNLNRCFFEGNSGAEPEDKRARELMTVLDSCDALLDLHMFYDDDGAPFVICEDNAIDLASKLDVGIISTNWTRTEPGGSDGYMYLKGKIGLCVECGPITLANEYTGFAINVIYQFLKYFNMADYPVTFSDIPKRYIRAKETIYKTSNEFKLTSGLHNFDALRPNQLIATKGEQKYLARKGECIIFPHYSARVGEEAYILGQELDIT